MNNEFGFYADEIICDLKNFNFANEYYDMNNTQRLKFLNRVLQILGDYGSYELSKVEITRLSPPDTFVTPEECKDFGIDTVYLDDVMHVIISRYQLDHSLVLPQTIGDITFYNKKRTN